jgi:hypothetical protein
MAPDHAGVLCRYSPVVSGNRAWGSLVGQLSEAFAIEASHGFFPPQCTNTACPGDPGSLRLERPRAQPLFLRSR